MATKTLLPTLLVGILLLPTSRVHAQTCQDARSAYGAHCCKEADGLVDMRGLLGENYTYLSQMPCAMFQDKFRSDACCGAETTRALTTETFLPVNFARTPCFPDEYDVATCFCTYQDEQEPFLQQECNNRTSSLIGSTCDQNVTWPGTFDVEFEIVNFSDTKIVMKLLGSTSQSLPTDEEQDTTSYNAYFVLGFAENENNVYINSLIEGTSYSGPVPNNVSLNRRQGLLAKRRNRREFHTHETQYSFRGGTGWSQEKQYWKAVQFDGTSFPANIKPLDRSSTVRPGDLFEINPGIDENFLKPNGYQTPYEEDTFFFGYTNETLPTHWVVIFYVNLHVIRPDGSCTQYSNINFQNICVSNFQMVECPALEVSFLPFGYQVTEASVQSQSLTCFQGMTLAQVHGALGLSTGGFLPAPVVDVLAACDGFALDALDPQTGGNAHGFLTYAAAPTTGRFYQVTSASLQSASQTCLGVPVSALLAGVNLQEGQFLPDTVVTTLLACDPSVFSLDAADPQTGGSAHGFLTYAAAPTTGRFYQVTSASLQSASQTCLDVPVSALLAGVNLQEGQFLPDTVVSTLLACDPTVFSLNAVDPQTGGNAHGFLTYAAAPTTGYLYQVTSASLQSASQTCLDVPVSALLAGFTFQEGQLLPDTVVSTLLACDPTVFSLNAVDPQTGGNAHGFQTFRFR